MKTTLRPNLGGVWELFFSESNQFSQATLIEKWEKDFQWMRAQAKHSPSIAKVFLLSKEQFIQDRIEKTKRSLFEERFGIATSSALCEETKQRLFQFLSDHPSGLALGQFLFGHQFQPKANKTSAEVLKQHFNILNASHGYFDEKDFPAYQQIYFVCALVTAMLENHKREAEIRECAYKMMVLFGDNKTIFSAFLTLKAFDRFVKMHASQLLHPLSDILHHSLPKKGEWEQSRWQHLLKHHGVRILSILKDAKKIEQYLCSSDSKRAHYCPENRHELAGILSQFGYRDAYIYPKLARLYSWYRIEESIFDRTLTLLSYRQLTLKKRDSLPVIGVDLGREINKKHERYFLVRLPAGDLRGLILGVMTKSCQSIQDKAEICAIDGTSLDGNGFYVLVQTKKPLDISHIDWKNFEAHGHKIIGQGYIWRSVAGNLTFDSWENLRLEDDPRIVVGLIKLAEKIIAEDNTIARITIGLGGKTPKNFNALKTIFTERMKEGQTWGDALQQAEIHVNPLLFKAREALLTRFEQKTNLHLSHPQARNLTSFIINLAQFEAIDNITDQEFDIIIKNNALSIFGFEVYLQKAFSAAVKELEKNPIKGKLLISESAQEIYGMGQAKFSDLQNLETEKLRLLTSPETLKLYRSGEATFAELKEFPLNELRQKLNNASQPKLSR